MSGTVVPAPSLGWRRRSPLPGFGRTLGVTLVWVSLIVLLPLAALASRPWELGFMGV